MTIASISISTIIGLVAIIIYLYVQSISDTLVIQTKYGQIKGLKMVSRGGRRFSAFRAIPYAKPPVGDRRLRPPEEYGEWNGVYDGTVTPPVCLQADKIFKEYKGQEDCLILNVYTPNIITEPYTVGEELLPVMVFFHGGHFMHGSALLHGPQYFLDEDVVLVTVNYRLGALGFLNTGDEVVSGNMGLKDQVLALKWVKSTIKSLGGNPNLVTIFGESAGGAITELHTLSPLSKGLFERSISQSGTSLCPWALSTKTREAAEILARELDCPTGNSESMIKCLRGVDGLKFVEAHKATFEIFYPTSAIFGPSIENVKDKSKAFLTEHPREILRSGRQVTKVPHLFGVTSHDGCYRSAPLVDNEAVLGKLEPTWKETFAQLFVYDNADKPVSDQVAEKILKHYFGTTKFTPSLFTKTNYDELTQMFSDRYFFKCTTDSALFHAKAGPDSPVYMYFLTYQTNVVMFGDLFAASVKGYQQLPGLLNAALAWGKKNLYMALGWETMNYGVCHADDVLYMFSLHPLLDISTSSPLYEMSRAMVKTWVTFARDGNPGKFKGISWKQVGSNDTQVPYMALNKYPVMIKEPYTTGRTFWESLKLEN